MESRARLRSITLPALCALLAWGCSGDPQEEGSLPGEKLVEAYVALLRNAPAEPRDTVGGSGIGVLRSLGISEHVFRAGIREYGRDPVRWKEFYMEVARRLEEKPPGPAQGSGP